MNIELVTGPARYPVTLAEAKLHLGIPSADTGWDNYIKLLIAQATEHAEAFTGRKIVYQTLKAYLQCWPWGSFVNLPYGQLKSVSSIKYTDTSNVQTTWDAANYIVRTGDYGLVSLAYEKSWPDVDLYPVNPIEITFICGYYSGDEWAAGATKAIGATVVPTGYSSKFAYNADDAGTTGTTEPTWPTTIGATVVDNSGVNQITWSCIGESVPFGIRAGIMVYIADCFETRESSIVGVSHINLKRVESILWKHKVWK